MSQNITRRQWLGGTGLRQRRACTWSGFSFAAHWDKDLRREVMRWNS